MKFNPNPMKELRLSLKKKWFEMTKSGEKTEDYREVTPYWAARLFNKKHKHMTVDFWKGYMGRSLCDNGRQRRVYCLDDGQIEHCIREFGLKPFTSNVMTSGYPKSSDTDRILKYEHKGIEIRTGNPEWGAEPGKIYFVIMHGKRLD